MCLEGCLQFEVSLEESLTEKLTSLDILICFEKFNLGITIILCINVIGTQKTIFK